MDESLNGYVFRLAMANRLTESDFANLIGYTAVQLKSPNQKARNEIVNGLISLTGFSEISELFDKRCRSAVYKHLFEYKTQKFCSQCIRENAYIRALWDFKNYVTCHIHTTSLKNICEECGAMFTASCAIAQKCISCDSPLLVTSPQVGFPDSISQFIADVVSEVEVPLNEKLACIQYKIEVLEPFIRLQLGGGYKTANDIRKSDLQQFINIQAEAHRLMSDEERSVELLSTQLAKQIAATTETGGLSPVVNRYRTVINDAVKHPFSNVLRRSIISNAGNASEHWLSLDLISKLWQVDEDRVLWALDQINPTIRQGKRRIKCTVFARYVGEVLSLIGAERDSNQTYKVHDEARGK